MLGDGFFLRVKQLVEKGFARRCRFLTSHLSSLSQDLFLAVACFAGEIGGNMDLFLRSSILTVCEFEHFVIYICHICHKKESITP